MNTTMNKCQLLKRLKALDFAVIEASLFLDTHPKDPKALAYFREKNEERQMAYDQYVEMYGPLTIFDAKASDSWDWVETPWPWEMED